jgi:hypothetical protein
MQLLNDFLDWFNSSEGTRVVTTMVLPFLAIVVAGIIAAIVIRGSIARLLSKQEVAQRASAVEALIAVGEKGSQWSGLSGQTRDHFEAQTSVASIRVRLLPAPGAAMASAWAEYQLAEIKRNSANFSVAADQGYAEYRDRLIEWHHRPSRARKLFTQDIERFRLDSAGDDIDLIERQRRWKAEQAATVATPTSSATAAPVAPVVSTPIVPAASARAFTPKTETPKTETPKVENATTDATTDGTSKTEVIGADAATATSGGTRLV